MTMQSNEAQMPPQAVPTAWELVQRHKDKLWYLAHAYSGKNKAEVEENVHEATVMAGLLMEQGFHIHHPTYFTHHVARVYDLPTNFEHWVKYNEFFIDQSYGIFVVKRKMKLSRGVKYELDYGKRKWKPAFVVDRMGLNFIVQEMYEAWPEFA